MSINCCIAIFLSQYSTDDLYIYIRLIIRIQYYSARRVISATHVYTIYLYRIGKNQTTLRISYNSHIYIPVSIEICICHIDTICINASELSIRTIIRSSCKIDFQWSIDIKICRNFFIPTNIHSGNLRNSTKGACKSSTSKRGHLINICCSISRSWHFGIINLPATARRIFINGFFYRFPFIQNNITVFIRCRDVSRRCGQAPPPPANLSSQERGSSIFSSSVSHPFSRRFRGTTGLFNRSIDCFYYSKINRT